MAKVGTVVPRCPRIVGEIGIVTDPPIPGGPPGTSGPTFGTPIVFTKHTEVIFSGFAFILSIRGQKQAVEWSTSG